MKKANKNLSFGFSSKLRILGLPWKCLSVEMINSDPFKFLILSYLCQRVCECVCVYKADVLWFRYLSLASLLACLQCNLSNGLRTVTTLALTTTLSCIETKSWINDVTKNEVKILSFWQKKLSRLHFFLLFFSLLYRSQSWAALK
jgi:hypothetical protein